MKHLLGGRLISLTLAMPVLLAAGPDAALAQGAERAAGRMETLVEEITVTARKREESLQDAPISISAFTGEGLEARGFTEIDQLAEITPNLTFYNYSPFLAGGNSATVFLRGVGQTDFAPTTEPGVGIYVDGVYFGRTVGSVLNLVDFERVEVLRGPQGTLFGRNTIGGAISITSKKPHDEFELSAEATVGTDDRIDGKGTLNLPITDKLFGRITLATYNQEGFIKHETTGRDYGDTDTIAGRAALRWIPVEPLELNWAFDYSSDREHGLAEVYSGAVFIPSVFIPPATFIPGNFTYLNNVDLGFLTGCDGTPANPAGTIGNPGCVNDQWLGQKNGNTANDFSNVDVYGTSLTIDWSMLDSLDVRSVTAYRRIHSHNNRDADNIPLFILEAIEDIFKQEQISQELQLLGNSLGGKLEWILGFYYYQEEGLNPNPVVFLPVSIFSGGDFDHDSIAGFGQSTYHLTDRLHLTAGIRYTEDTKRFLADQFVFEDRTGGAFPVGTRTLPLEETKLVADDWTPAVSLAYDWTEELMTYVSYSEGFKGGGFHQRVFPPLPATPTFEPEFVTTYEGGFKYSGFGGRLRVNGAGFYSDYQDLQIIVLTEIAPVLDNGGDATIAGFELEGQWVPADTWFLEGSVGYLTNEYDTVLPESGLTGDEKLAYAPEWTLSASLSKEFGLAEWGSLVPRVDWSYRSDTEFDALNNDNSRQEGYHVVNANVSWQSNDERYGLVFGVNNLADEDYLLNKGVQEPFGTIADLRARDREWYLTLKFNY